MEANITFENLPKAVHCIGERLNRIEQLLQKKELDKRVPEDQIFGIKEASSFLNVEVSTIYTNVSRGIIPSMKRNGKLYFSKRELLEYLKGGKKLTYKEVEERAERILNGKGGQDD